MSFLWALAGALVAGVLLLAILALVATPLLQAALRRFFSILISDAYTGNVLGLVSIMRRLSPQGFAETMLRAGSGGRPIERPMGSPLRLSPWSDLLFTPAQLQRAPLAADRDVDLSVTIGPKARRPLKIETPLLVAAMSYGGALSVEAKIALARAANLAGTATNTGESYLAAERREAKRLIVQYHRGTWPMSPQNHPQLLAAADAIEIQIGQGAQAGAPMRTLAKNIDPRMRQSMGLGEGKDSLIDAQLQGVRDIKDLKTLVARLREAYPVPVGLKMAATDRIEEDIDRLLEAEVDFVCLDGAEGGTHGGPVILQDDFGLPTLHAIARADAHLRAHGRRQGLSLIATGGLHTPGNCLKALALGADACYLGTALMVSFASDQAATVAPWEPPYSLFFHAGSEKGRFDTEKATQRATDFLRSATAEMRIGMQALGKARLQELSREDMIALSPFVARLTGCRIALPPGGEATDLPLHVPPTKPRHDEERRPLH